ncbi:MAG TPA: glycosyltransferase [Polyangia bacterium]|nr:glycosyltransferase [Polyangia bacterium]
MARRLVFYLQGHIVPASRVRGRVIARALEGVGYSCELRVCHPSVYGDTGLPAPLGRWRPLFYPAALVSRLGQLGGLDEEDLVFFQRPLFEWPFTWLERRVARGRPSIFDFDDAIYLNPFGGPKLRRLVDLVDHVIAGNPTLAEAAGAPHKTTVIPTVIDIERFRLLPPRPARGREVVVGWTGTAGNYRQLATAKAGIARALRRTGARFLVIADRPPPPELAELRPEFVRWDPGREVEDLGRIDVGVMPLPDTPYARGKCAFKLLQYMALGRPGVASPVGVNRDVVTPGTDGFLAANDAAWEEALVALIEEPALRATLGQAARRRVEAAYSLPAVLPEYVGILRRLGCEPRPLP